MPTVLPAGSRVGRGDPGYLQGEGTVELKQTCLCVTLRPGEDVCFSANDEACGGGCPHEIIDARMVCCWPAYCCGTEHATWILNTAVEVDVTSHLATPSTPPGQSMDRL